jgi:hypothetical protein
MRGLHVGHVFTPPRALATPEQLHRPLSPNITVSQRQFRDLTYLYAC